MRTLLIFVALSVLIGTSASGGFNGGWRQGVNQRPVTSGGFNAGWQGEASQPRITIVDAAPPVLGVAEKRVPRHEKTLCICRFLSEIISCASPYLTTQDALEVCENHVQCSYPRTDCVDWGY